MYATDLPPGVTAILSASIVIGLIVAVYYILRVYYCPRSGKEWRLLFVDTDVRSRLRQRKKRLDAIRSRKPGSILPGIPTSMRDFALEPLIRNGKFKAAKSYIMEQIRRHRDSPESNGRMRVYVQYLELIEGAG